MNTQILEAYNSAQEALKQKKKQLSKYIECLRQVTKAAIQFDSITALVTKDLDTKEVSKTALKELVKGDQRVLDAKHLLEKLKANKEAIRATTDYLDDVYNLGKKRMDAEMSEVKYLGGQNG